MLNQKLQTNLFGYANQTTLVAFIKADLQSSLNELYSI